MLVVEGQIRRPMPRMHSPCELTMACVGSHNSHDLMGGIVYAVHDEELSGASASCTSLSVRPKW